MYMYVLCVHTCILLCDADSSERCLDAHKRWQAAVCSEHRPLSICITDRAVCSGPYSSLFHEVVLSCGIIVPSEFCHGFSNRVHRGKLCALSTIVSYVLLAP